MKEIYKTDRLMFQILKETEYKGCLVYECLWKEYEWKPYNFPSLEQKTSKVFISKDNIEWLRKDILTHNTIWETVSEEVFNYEAFK